MIHDVNARAGPLPAELGALRALEKLQLQNNQLSGEQRPQTQRRADELHSTSDVHDTVALVVDPPASANLPTILVSIRPSNMRTERHIPRNSCFRAGVSASSNAAGGAVGV